MAGGLVLAAVSQVDDASVGSDRHLGGGAVHHRHRRRDGVAASFGVGDGLRRRPRRRRRAAAAINTVQLICGAFGAGLAGVVVNMTDTGDATPARWLFAVFAVLAALGVVASTRSGRRSDRSHHDLFEDRLPSSSHRYARRFVGTGCRRPQQDSKRTESRRTPRQRRHGNRGVPVEDPARNRTPGGRCGWRSSAETRPAGRRVPVPLSSTGSTSRTVKPGSARRNGLVR